MYYTHLLGKTSKSVPKEIGLRGSVLLYQAGYIRTLGQGLACFLPLGMRVIKRLTRVIKKELQPLGGEEMMLPLISPVTLWERNFRFEKMRSEALMWRDRRGRELILLPSHEEEALEIVRLALSSFREFPVFLYSFHPTYYDGTRTRNGIVQMRESYIGDGYSFHSSFSSLNNFFPRMHAAYSSVMKQCGIPFFAAEGGDTRLFKSSRSFRFFYQHSSGDSVAVKCTGCSYASVTNNLQAVEKREGDKIVRSCIICGAPLVKEKVFDIAGIFKLDDYFAKGMRFQLKNERGRNFFPHMGAYKVNMGRLLALAAEANNDKQGLMWPNELAPFSIYLMGIGKSDTVNAFARKLSELYPKNILIDDRKASITMKLKDFRLLGIPVAIVISLEGLRSDKVEVIDRWKNQTTYHSKGNIMELVDKLCREEAAQ